MKLRWSPPFLVSSGKFKLSRSETALNTVGIGGPRVSYKPIPLSSTENKLDSRNTQSSGVEQTSPPTWPDSKNASTSKQANATTEAVIHKNTAPLPPQDIQDMSSDHKMEGTSQMHKNQITTEATFELHVAKIEKPSVVEIEDITEEEETLSPIEQNEICDVLSEDIQEPHPLPNKKKQGISGESYNLAKVGAARDIQLPTYEKDEESEELIRSAIRNNEFLKSGIDSKELVQAVVDAMYLINMPADSYVIKEGESGSKLYICATGSFDVFKGSRKVNSLGPGKVFGELAILYNSPRNASILATSASTLWVLDRKVFHQVMMKSGMQRLEDNIKFLRSVPLLRKLDKSILIKMSDLLKVEFFPTATKIIKQGDEGSLFYIISGGAVTVTIKQPDGAEKEVGVLKRGDYFGERALLNDEKRKATVSAKSPGVECLMLDRTHFIQLLASLEELQEVVIKREHRESDTTPKTSEYNHIRLNDLERLGTLGVGGFGRVEFMQYKKDSSLVFALKKLKKAHIVELQQQTHVFNEKKIMIQCRSPFIARLYKTYKDSSYLYLLMESCLGGDVWTVLQRRRFFEEPTARFMTACVVSAFEYLHTRGIVYRDLKPENLLLDAKGYVKLVDFGFAKEVGPTSKTWTFAGTPEYLAPEIILNKGHDRSVDYWALGVFIHELLVGRPPFRGTDHMRTYNLILKGIDQVFFPKHVTKVAQMLVKKLCRPNPTERLGYQREGVAGIKNHRWFMHFDWDSLEHETMHAPIVPKLKDITDLSNFESFPKDRETPPEDNSGWDFDF